MNINFELDTERLEERIEDEAFDRVVNNVTKEIYGGFSIDRYNFKQSVREAVVEKIIEDCKDEIIEKAANILSVRLMRTKAAKEKLGEVIEDVLEENK